MKLFLFFVLAAVVLSLRVRIHPTINEEYAHTNVYQGNHPKMLILRRHQNFALEFSDGDIPDDSEFFFELVRPKFMPSPRGQKEIELSLQKKFAMGIFVLALPETIGLFHIKVKSAGRTIYNSASEDISFAVLANPWEEDDSVYFDDNIHSMDTPDRTEHVLNEFGAVWQGSSNSYSYKPWEFDHLNVDNLLAVMEMLGPLNVDQRSKTYLVVRWLTKVINDKVLWGRWDGEYADGKEPWFWSSSTQILSKWMREKRQVKYGQCWVFGCLLNTACRAIGIPAQVMTNFDSAHESRRPFQAVCDMYYYKNAEGKWKSSSSRSTCSIWNFHVWNLAWMKRPDLSDGDGWQAIDATAQEESSAHGLSYPFGSGYYCGPASLKNIKAQRQSQKYDTSFIDSETNAIVNWYVKDRGATEYTKTSTQDNHVGENIILKIADDICETEVVTRSGYSALCRNNIHHLFAHTQPLSSFREVDKAQPPSAFNARIRNLRQGDAEHEIGKPFKAEITFHPLVVGQSQSSVKFIQWEIEAIGVSNDGKDEFGTAASASGKHDVSNRGEDKMELLIDQAKFDSPEFLTILKKTLTVKFVFEGKALDSSDAPIEGIAPFFYVMTITLVEPRLSMQCGRNTYTTEQELRCDVTVKNPLTVPLTNVEASMTVTGQPTEAVNGDGHRFREIDGAPSSITINGGAEYVIRDVKFPLGTASGPSLAIVTVTSNELVAMKGSFRLTVTPAAGQTPLGQGDSQQPTLPGGPSPNPTQPREEHDSDARNALNEVNQRPGTPPPPPPPPQQAPPQQAPPQQAPPEDSPPVDSPPQQQA